MRTLAERLHDNRASLHLFAVLLDAEGQSGLERQCPPILAEAIRRGDGDASAASLVDIAESRRRGAAEYELIAQCSARLAPQLERFATDFRPLLPEPLLAPGYTGQFASKRFLAWTVNDLQEWLHSLDIREFYRQQFAEQGVDGFLAYSLTDADLAGSLRVDVQLSRKKLTREILNRLQAEQRDSWSGRCRLTKPRPGCVFLVCDPRRDAKTRDALKLALERRRVRVSHVEELDESRDDFLRKNGPAMAACGHVLVLLTEHSPRSAVFYHCVMFAEWLGRRVIVLFLTNCWFQLRPALRALLYDAQGLDFSGQPVADSLDELGSAIVAPERTHPAVVLEQSYVRKLARKLPPAGYLAHTSAPARSLDSAASSSQSQQPDPASPGFIRTRTGTQLSLAPSVPSQQHQQPAVFISYHWDSTEAVLELKRFLIAHAIRVQLDTDKSPDEGSMKIMKGVRDDGSRKVFIEKAMRDCHCVLLAVTPKYLRSENCQSDIEAAYRQRRPLLPVLLTFCAWPPDSSCAAGLRKRLAAIPAIDIGSERLAKKNLARLVQRVQQISGPP
ncbi:hypothetical protein BOX15_Mlig007340g1 [Macrostomum lignano]|uniref:SAM domain-containing protein n=1 Tax=Macrostomum lignano TaxID=282301 RepID=A0A267FGX3_9PLAT|nr:hypothetical protein BOX15_Mlig007340g1 [Macrostomum lignano]